MTAPGVLERTAVAALCLMLASSMLVASGCDRGAPTPSTAGVHATDAIGRTVDYRWYDFFNVPFGVWWSWRNAISYETYEVLNDSYPYLCRHHLNITHLETFSNARLNITGRGMPELNMNERPLFLPLLSGEDGLRGGNARIDWYMQYLTEYDIMEYLGYTPPWMDGWVVSLNGTAALDRTAAMAVMNMTSEEFDDFDAWWEDNEFEFLQSYVDWAKAEANDRLDVFSVYGYPFTPIGFSITPEKIGDEIILTYDIISWGMEVLMFMWLKDAFMPTEWWFEDFTMHAEIGPESADLSIDTAVIYAVYASETNEGGEPCWVWQGMLAHRSDSPYSYVEHLCRSPGSMWYGWMIPYEYTPECFNLSSGETMTFVCPDEDIVFLEHLGFETVETIAAPAVFGYSEPLPSDVQDAVEPSSATCTLTFDGPIDFWTWSQYQTEYSFLSSEWDRLGLLPYGLPYVEFTIWPPDTPPIAHLEAMHSPTATAASQYLLDASGSRDSEDSLSALEFRWDLDGDGTMDTEWESEPTVEHDFVGTGTFTVSVSVKDTDNMTDLAHTEIVILELDPPVTEASLEGFEGDDGWFVSAVTVNLTAEDDSGVAATMYRLGGLDWELYSSEFLVSSDGNYSLEFYSVDVESNYEEVQETVIMIDSTAPNASFETDTPTYPPGPVTVNWYSFDETSGVAYAVLVLDWEVQIPVGSESSHTFEGLTAGDHTMVLTVFDCAGNNATDTYTFSVEHTAVWEGGPAWLPLLVGGVLVAAAIIAGLLLLIRRKPQA